MTTIQALFWDFDDLAFMAGYLERDGKMPFGSPTDPRLRLVIQLLALAHAARRVRALL